MVDPGVSKHNPGVYRKKFLKTVDPGVSAKRNLTPGSIERIFRKNILKMPRRLEFQENCYYHIYNRWLNKQTLFFCWKDFERFLWYIVERNKKFNNRLSMISYSILPNHFHFVFLNKEQWFAISEFIWKITSSYWKYIGAKYWIKWNIFESRFKSKLLDNEMYLNQCIHYVEFNAVKHQLVEDINQWLFTSFDRLNPNRTPNDEILSLNREF